MVTQENRTFVTLSSHTRFAQWLRVSRAQMYKVGSRTCSELQISQNLIFKILYA